LWKEIKFFCRVFFPPDTVVWVLLKHPIQREKLENMRAYTHITPKGFAQIKSPLYGLDMCKKMCSIVQATPLRYSLRRRTQSGNKRKFCWNKGGVAVILGWLKL
jgi:hypothetical protein